MTLTVIVVNLIGMNISLTKELEHDLKIVAEKLRNELAMIRGSRPSVDLLENIKVNLYEQEMTIKQLGSISIIPPRGIQISVWDKNAVGAVMKAIENAKIGLSVSNDGNNIIATLSQLGTERREELSKLVRKQSEHSRIQVRANRDDFIKKLREAESEKKANEDEVFKTKEKIQKLVDEANKQIESVVEKKLQELAE